MTSPLDPPVNPGRARGGLSLALIALPALYMLMLGPVALSYAHFPDPAQQAVDWIYSPLEWLDDRIPGQPFRRYVKLWLR